MTTFDKCSSEELSVEPSQGEIEAIKSQGNNDSNVGDIVSNSVRLSVSRFEKMESREDDIQLSDDGFVDGGSDAPSTDAPESETPSMDRTSTMDPIKVEPSFLVVKGPPPGFESQPQQPPGGVLKTSAQQAPEFDKLEQLMELQQLMDEVAMLEKQLAIFSELAAKQMQATATTTAAATTGRTSLRSVRTNAKMFVPMQGNDWAEPGQSNYWADWASPQSNDWADWAASPASAPPGLESGF